MALVTPDVFLLDVDNTLLDNDRAQNDFHEEIEQSAGPWTALRYWQIFEDLRGKLGYADYLGALQRYRVEHMHDPNLLRLASYLLDYPFAKRLYPPPST
jgi:FMN phosphatase YigB (HAD superfamily)